MSDQHIPNQHTPSERTSDSSGAGPSELGPANDPLLARVRASDPAQSFSPSEAPGDHQRQESFERIMAGISTTTGPNITGGSAAETNINPRFAPPPTREALVTKRRAQQSKTVAPQRNRGRTLAAVAAVIALIATGVALTLPGSTKPAIAAVRDAAASTGATTSGRVTTTFVVVDQADPVAHHLEATLEAAYNRADLSFSLEFAFSDGAETGVSDEPIEGRLVDGTLYGSDGSGDWYSVETGNFLVGNAIGSIDPRTVLATIDQLVDTTEIGPTTVDGQATTHYQSTVDLNDETLSQAGWLAGSGMEAIDVAVAGTAIVDLFIDEDGILRAVTISADASDGTDNVQIEVTTRFHGLGEDISIEIPDDSVTTDLGDMLSDELDG